MNIIARAIRSIFYRYDPLVEIGEQQSEIVRITQKAEDNVTFARERIEYAVDTELDNIRGVVGTAFGRITHLVGTGALHTDSKKAIEKAKKQIEDALTNLDEAI